MLSRRRISAKFGRYKALIYTEINCNSGVGFQFETTRGNVVASVKGTMTNALICNVMYPVDSDDIAWLKEELMSRSKKFNLLEGVDV